jgi:hypothetical protein
MKFPFRLILAVGVLGLCAACTPKSAAVAKDRQEITTTVGYDTTVDVSPGETVLLQKTSSRFTFLDVISDNRCPKGVNCIQAGEAVVRIGLPDGGVRELTVGGGGKNLPRFSLENGIVQIVALTPYPEYENNIPQQDYRLRLKIAAAAAL